MTKFTLKTYNPAAKTELPHFYILCKGKNSGKPLSEPCPNCFVLTAKSEEEKQFLFDMFDEAQARWANAEGLKL